MRKSAVHGNGNGSVVEHKFDRLTDTPAPMVTSAEQAAATVTEVTSAPSSQPQVATPEATAAPLPTPTFTAAPTHTPTMAPTAVASSGSASPTTTAIANPEALAERGIKVYHEQYCGICHQLDAANTGGLFGPTHNGLALTGEQRLRDPRYAGKATTAGDYIRESILNPGLYLVEGYEHTQHYMPAYANLSETDLDALVWLLLQQE